MFQWRPWELAARFGCQISGQNFRPATQTREGFTVQGKGIPCQVGGFRVYGRAFGHFVLTISEAGQSGQAEHFAHPRTMGSRVVYSTIWSEKGLGCSLLLSCGHSVEVLSG